MGKCCICGHGVSHDFESISIGLLKKKDLPICDKCSMHLKIITDKQMTECEYEKSKKYFDDNKENMTERVQKHINSFIKQQIKVGSESKVKKTRGKIYFVDKLLLGVESQTSYGKYKFSVPIQIPQYCTCCMSETKTTEFITARCTSSAGMRKTIRKLKLKFPLCKECKTKRHRPSVKITSFTVDFGTFGMMFTNEEYAKLFAKLNNTKYSEFEDDGFISAMRF